MQNYPFIPLLSLMLNLSIDFPNFHNYMFSNYDSSLSSFQLQSQDVLQKSLIEALIF
ncbi:unnamed protein product [Blumeria hordei]|uniref:Uncharacterized protein n=1 Tax=Blumeria hordei TaxID=2867405 RepID=A0A383UXG5_BLUHO|nr:unnamed protein product [Blumeria hordei]